MKRGVVTRWSQVVVGWRASRPAQLVLVAGVYLLGAKAARALGSAVTPPQLLAGLVPLLPVAASIHYANEYADYETDMRTDRTPFSGGSGALPKSGVPRRFVLHAAIATLALGMALGSGLWSVGWLSSSAGWLLVVGAVFGWQYSLPPLALAWRGLGELDNAALGGLVLPAYGAAVVGGPIGLVALAAVPFALVVLCNLFATQWPDREADAAVGKDTLAVRWPATRLRIAYVGIAVAAGLALIWLHPTVIPTPVAVASLPVVPLVALGANGYTRRHVPWPTVSAMVGLATLQLVAWCWVGA